MSKHIDTVIVLLGAKGINVNAVDYKLNNALHYAAGNGDIEIIKALAGRVCLDTFGGDDGFTALQIATQYGFDEAVQALIDAKANVNIMNFNTGNTALHLAVYFGKEKVVKDLINAKARVDIKNNEYKTAFDIANAIKDETKRKIIIKLLTTQKFDLKNSEVNPLIPEFNPRELKKRKDPEVRKDSAAEYDSRLLHKAAIEGKLDDVKSLIENFPNMINASTDNKVQITFDHINGKAVKVFNALLEDKTPKTGYTPIEFAAISGDNDDKRIKIIALLYKNGAKINLEFFKALFDYKKISKNLKEKIIALDPKNLDFDKLENLPKTNPASSLAIRAQSNEGAKEGPSKFCGNLKN